MGIDLNGYDLDIILTPLQSVWLHCCMRRICLRLAGSAGNVSIQVLGLICSSMISLRPSSVTCGDVITRRLSDFANIGAVKVPGNVPGSSVKGAVPGIVASKIAHATVCACRP